MVNRKKDQINEDGISEERLEQLSKFQITILKHAFKFPKVKRIVYSTCSIHEKENEQVVEEVMSSVNQNFKMRLLLPDWSERGVSSYEHAQCCLRMSHGSALTNGFFVACFERKGDIESNTSGTETHFAQSKIIDYNLEEIKHKHKKRKKLKNIYEDDSAIQYSPVNKNIDVISVNSDSRKRKLSHPDNDVIEKTREAFGDEEEHRHRNTCKKKRKKSKQRYVVEDSNKIENVKENDIEHKHTNSCKKKRKKSKQRDIVVEKNKIDNDNENDIEHKHTNSCKKKRKKSKQRESDIDTIVENEPKHTYSCKKKRKKSKQRDTVEEKVYDPRHEKTNDLVFELVRHKPGCTATEDG